MYLAATITVDPAQLTDIVRVRPTKMFARLAHTLTQGMSSKQEEHETFTAIAILQQLNMVLRSVGVDDIVRITKDGTDFYEDKAGVKGDLKEALTQFANHVGKDELALFDTLDLVLQHSADGVDYLLDVRISRTHKVDEHPIRIHLNAFPTTLNSRGDDSNVQGLLQRVFASQDKYDKFTSKYSALAESFVSQLDNAFKTHMKVDAVHTAVRTKIIRPDRQIRSGTEIPVRDRRSYAFDGYDDYDPAYDDYYGSEDAFFYAWLWSEMCFTNNVVCYDCDLVSETGETLLHIDNRGLDAGATDIMNTDVPFEEAIHGTSDSSSSDESGGHASDEVMSNLNASEDSDSSSRLTAGAAESGGGWLSSLASFASDFGGGCSGDSSCSGGCGGCGGGCGGE